MRLRACSGSGADLADGANDDTGCKGAYTHKCGEGCVQAILVLSSAAASLMPCQLPPYAPALVINA